MPLKYFTGNFFMYKKRFLQNVTNSYSIFLQVFFYSRHINLVTFFQNKKYKSPIHFKYLLKNGWMVDSIGEEEEIKGQDATWYV